MKYVVQLHSGRWTRLRDRGDFGPAQGRKVTAKFGSAVLLEPNEVAKQWSNTNPHRALSGSWPSEGY